MISMVVLTWLFNAFIVLILLQATVGAGLAAVLYYHRGICKAVASTKCEPDEAEQ